MLIVSHFCPLRSFFRRDLFLADSKKTCVEPKNQNKNTNIIASEMLEIVLTPKILGPPELGALGSSLFSLMVNPRLFMSKWWH